MKQEIIKINDNILKDISKEINNKDIIGQIKGYIENNIDDYFTYKVKQDNHKIFLIGYNCCNAFARTYKTTYENSIPDFKRVSL